MKLLNYQHYQMVDLVFSDNVMKKGYNSISNQKWETTEPNSATKVLGLGEVLFQKEGYTSSSIVLESKDALIAIDDNKTTNDIQVEIAASNMATVNKLLKQIKKLIPVAPEPIATEISVRFWYLSPNGPKAVHRNIAAPDWDTIKLNYAKNTHDGLSHLMNKYKPTGGGQLVLWHGEPGTGKTYALRALCQAWKKWCSVEYIMDPETLLGASPGYLASMIMNDASYDEENEDEDSKPWKLLIMEDTGELLTEHARERAGQGLSRLLNVVDGFIGQGLRVLVLITTNEEFHTLHPAVSREGRCAASIKFEPLGMSEAEKLLKSNGIIEKIVKPTNLAEIYAMIKNETNPRDKTGIKTNGLGFRVPTQVS